MHLLLHYRNHLKHIKHTKYRLYTHTVLLFAGMIR